MANSGTIIMAASIAPILLGSCATVMQGKSDPVKFATVPAGGSVTVDGTIHKTPSTVEVSKKTTSATFSLPGQGSKTGKWDRKFQEDYVLMNVIFTPGMGSSGTAVDTASGAIWQQPESVTYNFKTGRTEIAMKPPGKSHPTTGNPKRTGKR
ncbi:hypothetical protein KBB96_19590 [Luteolibacter ambystomatis]|uniref:Uncharacterized protein n=1 Tax=Luteolibacter ambystomatis TaxID=2824561 RepID=A0A975IZ33_9BACT|nr:hypothetical protein [Luteolibacter ambystomatis]QUE51046.1 hypothetical protein KBB96_19590 [Luteolibacter ambystomatis]